MDKRPLGDVVVLIPGITGSVLSRDGKDVWALSGGAALNAVLSLGRSITSLGLVDDPPDVDDLGDGVTAPRLMNDMHLIPGLWRIDGYSRIEESLFARYQVERGANYFPFPYDWRRDNRVHARRLARESERWLAEWRERSGNADAKLILIAHSMGGLVARYFLEALDGWRSTRALITFGTPYRGSVNALGFLTNGIRRGIGPFKLVDLSSLIRTFTSVYQLLPDYKCLDVGDGLVHLADLDLPPGIDPQRFQAATEFHRSIEAKVGEHLDDDEYRRDHYRVHPIVGVRQATSQSARLEGGNVVTLRSYDGVDTDGDGTVPLQSATPPEWVDGHLEVFSADRHATLQNADSVLIQLDGLLRDERVRFRAAPVEIGLDLDDVFEPAEPVRFAVRASKPGVPMMATIVDRSNGAEVARTTFTGVEEWDAVELAPVPTGTYELRVAGLGAPPAKPVSDVFVVFGEEDEARAMDPAPSG
jgi:pimeloyl-ACP methyl ester carboxylesterase